MSVRAPSSIQEVDRQLAEQWLGSELNRMWLVAERCLRQFQRAGLRAAPDNPALAEIEGIFTARRAARGGLSTGPLDEAELTRALTDVDSQIASLRRAAPIGRMVENLNLNPLEVETLVVASGGLRAGSVSPKSMQASDSSMCNSLGRPSSPVRFQSKTR